MSITFRPDQLEAFHFGASRFSSVQGVGYILPMGAGKTGLTLRLLDYLRITKGVDRVLVTAPLRVLHHWADEQVDWETSLPVHVCHGEDKTLALKNSPGIYAMTHSALEWLAKTPHAMFHAFVVDEGSKFKNWSAQRTKAARRIASKTPFRITLTGKPTPNCPSEIFPQMFMLDLGQTLGSTITEFRDNWMRRGGYENRDWLFIQGMEDMLAAKVRPYYLRQQQLSHLPPLIQNDISIPLPDDVRATYKRFESDMFAEMADSPDLIAFSGGHKYGMCRQLASGGYYDLDGNPQKFHSAKAEALKEMILDTEGPILVAYQWWHELHQIRRTLNYDVPAINSSTSLKQSQQIIQDWIAGKIPVLLCHPQAMSHGVNGLQKRGNVLIWYSLTNSPDDYDQLNARLHRTGQENTTFIHHLLAKGTIDRRVLRVLREKASLQEAFMDVLTANREPRANQSPVAAFGPNQQQIPWTGVI